MLFWSPPRNMEMTVTKNDKPEPRTDYDRRKVTERNKKAQGLIKKSYYLDQESLNIISDVKARLQKEKNMTGSDEKATNDEALASIIKKKKPVITLQVIFDAEAQKFRVGWHEWGFEAVPPTKETVFLPEEEKVLRRRYKFYEVAVFDIDQLEAAEQMAYDANTGNHEYF